MKNLFFTIGICLFCFHLQADTIYYKSGIISCIRESRTSYMTFYENGNVQREVHEMHLLRLGNTKEYDSTGSLTAEGKTFFFLEHHKWNYYKSGKLIETKRFRYGIPKDSLRNSSGKKVDCLLIYGKPMWSISCQASRDTYKAMRVTVAGCVVSRALVIRANLHNIRIGFWKALRYGFNWQEKMDEACQDKRKIVRENPSP
jgi:hypothetical protein